MAMNKRFVLDILVRITAVVGRSRLRKLLPGRKLWLVLQNRLFGDIPFNFEAEVGGTRFRLQGPFRHAGGYYTAYLTQGAYESAVTAHITQVVRQYPTPRVLDVGAHYGWYTIYLAKIINNRGVVFSFEPSETIFSTLKRNVELNDLHNVHLYKLPLSDKQETVSMVVSKSFPREARYMAVIEEGAVDNYGGALGAIPFDEINEIEAIHPNIVKIDVRSVWRKVVDGMKGSLQRDVKHLYLELDTPSGDLSSQYEDVRYVVSMLRDIGMDVYEIENFRGRDGGRMIEADENKIARTNNREAMLYAVKRR